MVVVIGGDFRSVPCGGSGDASVLCSSGCCGGDGDEGGMWWW